RHTELTGVRETRGGVVADKVPLLRPASRRLGCDERELEKSRRQDAQAVLADARHRQEVLARAETGVARNDELESTPAGTAVIRTAAGKESAARLRRDAPACSRRRVSCQQGNE